MEKVNTGIRKFAVISSISLVFRLSEMMFPVYSRVRKNSRILEPKLPTAKITVFRARVLYLSIAFFLFVLLILIRISLYQISGKKKSPNTKNRASGDALPVKASL